MTMLCLTDNFELYTLHHPNSCAESETAHRGQTERRINEKYKMF